MSMNNSMRASDSPAHERLPCKYMEEKNIVAVSIKHEHCVQKNNLIDITYKMLKYICIYGIS